MDVQRLLTLPRTSGALSALQPPQGRQTTEHDAGSGSPPRKLPRLDSSSDLGSTLRSRRRMGEGPGRPIRIQIGNECVKQPPQSGPTFALLKRSIRTILIKDVPENIPSSYEGIYSACRFIVCACGQGEGLYTYLKIELEQCVGQLAQHLVRIGPDAAQWVSLLVQTCDWYGRQISLLQSLLTYLDQAFVRRTTGLQYMHDLAFVLFAERIFGHPQIVGKLESSINEWVSWERENKREHQIRNIIPNLVSHLVTYGQYSGLFEPFYINLTRSFYESESLTQWERLKNDAGKFLDYVQSRVTEEASRAKAALLERSCGLVEEVTEKALLNGRLQDLTVKAIGPFMDEKRMDQLSTLYGMCSRVGGLTVLCSAFKAHVMKTVQDIVQDVDHDDEMVQRLLDFKGLTDDTLNTAFSCTPSLDSSKLSADRAIQDTSPNNTQLSYALIDAFQRGFKSRRNKPAEMIAKYMDKAMREPNRDISDAEFEKRLDAVLALYRFTDDKDVFRTFYYRSLAKRLLLERSASDDAEKLMLKKLKEQYDPEFGMGDHMFNDLALSREMMRSYHSRLAPDSFAQKLSVMVLQQSVWPFSVRKSSVDLSPSMQIELNNYAAFYKTKHQGRKIDWDHALGTAVLRAQFSSGSKELSVSLYQAVVLLLFNDAVELPFSDILAQTNMGDAELRRTLQSLASGKKRVLKKIPPGRNVDDGDVFRFNTDFTDPRQKVHINSIQVKELPEESKRTQMSVEGDRKHYVDAAIVRIMKARKELSYEQLKMATIEAVKSHFVPEVSTIKQRIQVLVEQDYLKRNEEDMSLYVYVA